MPAPACLLKRVVFSSWSWQLLQVTAGTCRLNLYSCIIPASENFLKNLYVNKKLPYIALPHARCCKIAPSSHVMHAGFTVHVAVQPPRALPLLHLAVSPGGLKKRQGKKKKTYKYCEGARRMRRRTRMDRQIELIISKQVQNPQLPALRQILAPLQGCLTSVTGRPTCCQLQAQVMAPKG